ncbi:MAG: hypothetical protein Crog4KO_14900 [Crocinitomicaceae bacterium]
MAGGGFMKHASDTNRKDKAQKMARREKFNGNHSDKTTMGESHSNTFDFSHISEEQTILERKRIQVQYSKRRKQNMLVLIVVSILVAIGLGWLFTLL